jgi:hypothetical protein
VARDVVPGLLTGGVHFSRRLNFFDLPVNPAIEQRLGTLGLILGVCAAIVTSETFSRQKPFRLWHFFATVTVMCIALLPFIGSVYDVDFNLPPEALGIVANYCFLLLDVMLGMVIGGAVSLILRPLRPYFDVIDDH